MTEQRNMAFFGPEKVKDIEDTPRELVRLCRNFREALRLAIQYGRKTDAWVADHLGIDRGQFSRILHGKAWFPDDQCMAFCRLVGNWTIYQYREIERQGIDAREQRIAALQAELQALGAA